MIVLVYYISDHFRKTANSDQGKKKNHSIEMRNAARTGGSWGRLALQGMLQMPKPRWAAVVPVPARATGHPEAGFSSSFKLPALNLLPHGTGIKSRSLGARRMGLCHLRKEKGRWESREVREGSGEPRVFPAPEGTLPFFW